MGKPLSKVDRDKWLAIVTDIENPSSLTLLRAYHSLTVFHSPIAIYAFSDASTKAYGAVVYVGKGNQISVALAKN